MNSRVHLTAEEVATIHALVAAADSRGITLQEAEDYSGGRFTRVTYWHKGAEKFCFIDCLGLTHDNLPQRPRDETAVREGKKITNIFDDPRDAKRPHAFTVRMGDTSQIYRFATLDEAMFSRNMMVKALRSA